MINDSLELSGYFRAVENLFDLYEVPATVSSKLLIPLLSDKAKMPISRLSKTSLDIKMWQMVYILWSVRHQKALISLKIDYTRLPSYIHTVEYGNPFVLSVDASATSVGCCLIQWSDDGSEKPIAFGSSKLTVTQRTWATIEREAVTIALHRFKSFIIETEIVIFSDRNPLTYMNDCAAKIAKLTRWSL